MASALETIRSAGFKISLTDDSRLFVKPADRITDELREFVRAHRAELIESLQAEQAAPPPPTPAPALTHAEWAMLDKAYQSHHQTCAVCIAAGKGYGLRCGTGAALWANYDQSSEPPRTNPARKDVRQ